MDNTLRNSATRLYNAATLPEWNAVDAVRHFADCKSVAYYYPDSNIAKATFQLLPIPKHPKHDMEKTCPGCRTRVWNECVLKAQESLCASTLPELPVTG
ncbi:hypothetical protein EBZ38_08240 [bacterium]|nr:hypothetical protein [bacterium]NDD84244.1 hypothetical protein [bacterium]